MDSIDKEKHSSKNVEDWQAWITGVEYEDSFQGVALSDPKLERLSRFLIRKLKDLYHGIVQPFDRPTTEQCNKILNELEQYASHNKANVEAFAFRADTILQCMQLFLNILPEDYSNARLPYPLPLPDRDTYVHVLTLYSKAKHLSATRGPVRALEIIQAMKRQSQKCGDLNLQPIAHDYNKVLLAWGTSVSPKKAFYAANLLLQLKRDGLCDDKSYTHVLRACAFSKFDGDDKRAQTLQLAVGVAVKVYHDMVKNNIECTDLTYSYYLRACSFLENEQQRNHEVEEAFRRCRKEGKVDDTIIMRLKSVASPSLWKQLMGNLAHNDKTVIKARDLPPEWTHNAN